MTFLYIYLGCWFLCNFEPLQDLINWAFNKMKPNYFTNAVWTILGCQYCSTLWATLFLTGSITMALVLSALAQLHKSLIKES